MLIQSSEMACPGSSLNQRSENSEPSPEVEVGGCGWRAALSLGRAGLRAGRARGRGRLFCLAFALSEQKCDLSCTFHGCHCATATLLRVQPVSACASRLGYALKLQFSQL